MSFVHLHVRSAYSFLEGTIRVRELVKKAREYGMPAVALTDLGQMFGIWKFCREAVREGVQPVLGVEAFVSPGSRRAHGPGEAPGTLVLLARDLSGYRNLTRLTSRANMEGFFHRPRVDAELLKEHGGGLIVLSSGENGDISRLAAAGDLQGAAAAARLWARVFPGRFYLELQGNSRPEQARVNDCLLELSRTLGLPLVACAEARFLNKEDHGAWEVLQRIRTRRTLGFDGPPGQGPGADYYFKGPTEMRLEFSGQQEALNNTLAIAAMCHVDFPEKRLFAAPRPDIGPPGPGSGDYQTRADDHFLRLCREGLEAILREMEGKRGCPDPELEAAYHARLRREALDIIECGASVYFLVVADYANHARAQGIPISPGRGAAPSSLVCFSLGITEVDPIAFGLTFELFLNTTARGFPLIELEAPLEGAEELVGYISDTYGGSHFVAHSLKLELLSGRALLREVGQAFGAPLPLLDELCGMHPTHRGISLKMAVEEISLIKSFAESIPVIKKIIDYALFLENLPRAASARPFSLVASPRMLRDSAPLFLDYNNSPRTRARAAVEYGDDAVSENGLLRFDISPSRPLSLIAACLRLVSLKGNPPDLGKIPLDDPQALALLKSGGFSGLPSLENPWVGGLVRRFPDLSFSDLVVVCALHPPLSQAGGLAQEYLAVRRGEAAPQSLHPALDHILGESGGLLLCREQAVEIARAAAGGSAREAETLVRTLASGDPEALSVLQPGFLARSARAGFEAREARAIWLRLSAAAPVTVLKAHAVSLAMVIWRTAALKARHPGEFMDAYMRAEAVNREKQASALREWRSTHLRLVPPSAG